MSPRNHQPQFRAAALATAMLLAPALIMAAENIHPAGAAQSTPGRKAAASRQLAPGRRAPAARSVSRRNAPTSKAKSKSKRRLSDRQRRALLRPQSGRVQEIQQALVQAGYLHAEVTGRWDDLTRDAMRRYQKEHGFPATGLPEAKSLMKLGLGPHPLPSELDSSVVAQANADTSTPTNDNPSASPSPSSHPLDAASPPQR